MSNSPKIFSESFYSQVTASNKKEKLIDTIANRIYEKHKDVISFDKVK
jgi:hypothetical protein